MPDAGESAAEQGFASAIEDMLAREEYLFPYAWAQRVFRQDNYQMASQALLEDMFFDTLGDYLHRHRPGHELVRRTGAESWDYTFDGQGFSHKEGTSPSITAVWQAGEGLGNRTPKWPTWEFAEPVVFTYTNPSTRVDAEVDLTDSRGRPVTLRKRLKRLTYRSVQESGFAGPNAFVLLGRHDRSSGLIHVDHVWPRAVWDAIDLHEMRRIALGDLAGTDGWLMSLTQSEARRGVDPAAAEVPLMLRVHASDLATGVYVFPRADLAAVPLAANNKAHFATQAAIVELMRRAEAHGHLVALPLWPTIYADLTPPNLYQEQKARYDRLFQART